MTIWQWIKKLLAKKDPTPEPPTPAEEWAYLPGVYLEKSVNIAGGSWSAEVFVPEDGRATDWGTAEIFAIYDADKYHSKTGLLFSLHPYKIKFCNAAKCKEPRYNLPWSQWRKVKCEWTAAKFTVTIDGHKSTVACDSTWSSNPKAIYGCHPNGHCLTGAKLRNVKWE